MPKIDLSILNQKQTPAFYASSLATRPAFGFPGRIFIDTDSPSTGLYRDTGAAWVQIADPGAGTTGTLQQVTTNGNTTTQGITITAGGLSSNIVTLAANGLGSTANYIGQTYASNDTWKIYGTGTVADQGEMIFEVGDNGAPYASLGERFRFAYNASSSGTSKDVLIIDYDLSYFNTNLGINTTTPGAAIDVHSGINVIAQLNQTVATNNSLLAFQNSGTGLWRIGNYYNAGDNDFGIFDVVGAIQPLTIKKTSGQVLIGTSTVGSGKLVVASASSDNGIQIVGASAPSLRIDSAESGPTKRIGFGLATNTNNFIQGSIDRDMCIFNGSTGTAGSILFGIYNTVLNNVQEAARINQSQNFLIGTSIDNGYKLYVSGNVGISNGITAASATFSATAGTVLNVLSTNATTDNILLVRGDNGNNVGLVVKGSGNVGLGTTTPVRLFTIFGGANTSRLILQNTATGQAINNGLDITMDGTDAQVWNYQSGSLQFGTSNNERGRFTSSGNLLIGTTTDNGYKLQVSGNHYVNGAISATTSGGYDRYGFIASVCDSGVTTLSTIFPNVIFGSALLGLKITAYGYIGGNYGLFEFMCSRNAGTTWNFSCVNFTSTTGGVLPSLTFGGTTGAPTVQITGITLATAVFEIFSR